jgi:hypothetical protein
LIAAKFPTLKEEPETVADFLASQGLAAQLIQFAAEAVCDAVHDEDINLDIADLVLGNRNRVAFRALAENGADFGIFQHRSKGGKACLTNSDTTLRILVHNTDAATGLGSHAPAFASKRIRRGTHYAHNATQAELDLGVEVIEFDEESEEKVMTTIDVCIFAEKVDGEISCRVELLVDAEMNLTGSAFTACKQRFGMKIEVEKDVASNETSDVEDYDFENMIKPKGRNET